MPGPVKTLDGLVAALSEQGELGRGEPTRGTPRGPLLGKRSNARPRRDSRTAATAHAPFKISEGNSADGDWDGIPGYYESEGEIETLRILDVDGTIIVVNTRLNRTIKKPPQSMSLRGVLDSISIEQA